MNWPAVYPEIALLVAACVIALVDLWSGPSKTLTYWLAQASLAAVGALQVAYYFNGFTV